MNITQTNANIFGLSRLQKNYSNKNIESDMAHEPANDGKGSPELENKNYAKVTLVAKQSESQQSGKLNSLLNTVMSEAPESGSYAMRNLAGKKAARKAQAEIYRSAAEESFKALKENQKAIEERSAEKINMAEKNDSQIPHQEPSAMNTLNKSDVTPEIKNNMAMTEPPKESASTKPPLPTLNMTV